MSEYRAKFGWGTALIGVVALVCVAFLIAMDALQYHRSAAGSVIQCVMERRSWRGWQNPDAIADVEARIQEKQEQLERLRG